MKPRYIIAIVVALALILGVTLISYDKDRGFSLRFSSERSATAGGEGGLGGEASKSKGKIEKVSNNGGSTDDTDSVDAGSNSTSASAGGPGSAPGGSTNSGEPGDPTDAPSSGGSVDEPVAQADGMMVGIIFWNDTEAKKAKNVVISYGGSQFKPDVSKTSDVGSIGPCPYGETLVLKVYPEGTAGDATPLEFRFTVVKGMQTNGDRDAIHVAMTDGAVRVLGNPVIDFSQVRAR